MTSSLTVFWRLQDALGGLVDVKRSSSASCELGAEVSVGWGLCHVSPETHGPGPRLGRLMWRLSTLIPNYSGFIQIISSTSYPEEDIQ